MAIIIVVKKHKKESPWLERILSTLTPPKMFALSFIFIIIIGSTLLSLSVTQHKNIEPPNLIDIVFTSASAVSATGLKTLSITNTWNRLGLSIIMVMVQIGGLSFIVLISFLVLSLTKRINLTQRQGIQAAFGVKNAEIVKGVVNTSVKGTLLIEAFGFIVFFIALKGEGWSTSDSVFYGLAESVSVFSNAGLNLMGSGNLTHFRENKLILFVMIIISEISALGFIVWLDLIESFKKYKKNFSKSRKILNKTPVNKHIFKNFSLHTKLVLITTVVVHLLAIFTFIISEYQNPDALLDKPFLDKIFGGFLYSSASRFSGESYFDFTKLNEYTRFVSIILMMVGGGSGSVSGGIKTITIAVLFCCVVAILKGQDNIKVLSRTISQYTVMKAVTIFTVLITVLFISASILSLSFTITSPEESTSFVNILFETTSALSNTGLSIGITNKLTSLGKGIFIILMCLGRLGPITLTVFLNDRKNRNMDVVKFPEENVLVG